MNDYEWEYTDEEDLEEIARPRIHWAFKILTLVLIISFLALSFPWLNSFFNESFDLVMQNQELYSKDIVVATTSYRFHTSSIHPHLDTVKELDLLFPPRVLLSQMPT